MAAPALEVSDLVQRYGRTTALDGVRVRAVAGEVTALLGPNGAGKTTLVECAVGLRRPTSGTVRVLGADPATAGPDHRAAVGVVLQDGGLPLAATPRALLRHLARLHRDPADVDDLLGRLGLGGTGRTTVRRLSGGQRQRVALAAALVGRPRVVFLDEPTAGLDPQARLAVRDLVADLAADGVAVLLTTHDLDEASRSAHRVVILAAGRVVADGTPAQLTADRRGSVRFTAPPGVDTSALRLALPEDVEVRHLGAGGHLVSGDLDASALATVMSWCAAQGVEPTDVDTGRGDLEDVYLRLTGRGVR